VGFFHHVGAMVAKDLRIEFRSREIVYTMAFFSAMVVLLFAFAFRFSDADKSVIAAGMIWVSVIFAGTLGLSRAFDRERESDTMRGLLLAPIPRPAIFLGKAVAIAVFMFVVELVVLPMSWLLFKVPLFRDPLWIVALVGLATTGIAVVGSVFAGMLLRVKSRDVMLPVVLYPILVPAFMASVYGTTALWHSPPQLENVAFWCKFLLVYDAAFIVAGLWIFESLVIE
jgi:heme exporter protein CcmB